jgi:hypothetical protein
MPAVRPLAALLAALLAAFSACSVAAPFAILVGDARLAVDLPGGFADALPTGSPRVQELAESLTSASNRVLVFGLTDADLRRFNSGDAPELKQYLLIVTPRAQEQDRLSQQAFERTLAEAMRAVGKPVEGDFTKVLEDRPPGEPVLLAELERNADAASIVRAVRLPPPQGWFSFFKPSQYVVTSSSVILVRGKALTLTVASGYESKADVEWIRTVTLRWIDDLRRLNVSR